jgi:(4S)-4-hydroxy-5-phosphonooxypentane-2,3-dione isomerase
MLTVLIYIHIKPEHREAFEKATLENARNSVLETGIARFDLIRQADDPSRYVLIEVYRDPEAPARHRETAHYAAWREAAESMMAEPRTRVQYESLS